MTEILTVPPRPIRWIELEEEFKKLFPLTMQWVLDHGKAAAVIYCGNRFWLTPVPTKDWDYRTNWFAIAKKIEVWGPPAVSKFPNPYFK